jgi:RNA recognition motif-containing protein
MSWTQIHVSGLSETTSPDDEELERLLQERYKLEEDSELTWAGPGTTLIKRDKDTQACRGYCFLCFLSLQGASNAIEKINAFWEEDQYGEGLPPQLHAELSQPKAKAKKQTNEANSHGDVRLRRKRKESVMKHPVIVSSNKVKTGLGNKTR